MLTEYTNLTIMLGMKKYLLCVEFAVLFGCSAQNTLVETKTICHETSCIERSDTKQAMQYYEQSLSDVKLDDNKENISLTYEQIDALLYLSYIYLTDDNHKNIEKANKLINIAKKAIWQDCDGYHGHYDNFCYFQYYQDEIPTFVNSLDEAIIIYQMTLPCIYMDMIQGNEKAIGIIDSYFGSSRDASIPTLCDDFNPYDIVNVDNIASLKDYIFLQDLNKEPEIEGTMRFGLTRTRYHDFVYMLTYPVHYFKTDKFEDVHIEQFDTKNDAQTRFFAYQLEQEIYKYSDLTQAYNKMIYSLKQYYESSLKMNNKDAANYARMTASMIILQDIFIR